jgi:hypothetical protein
MTWTDEERKVFEKTRKELDDALILDALRTGRLYVARCNVVDDRNQPNLDRIDVAIDLVSRSLGIPSNLIGELADPAYAGKFR